MLADNITFLPKGSRKLASSLIANAIRREPTEKELRQAAKLIERIIREKSRLKSISPEPQSSGAEGF
jgi:hypothetical protein